MTTPQPDDPPFDGAACASWAQIHELPNDVQQLQNEQAWCSILALASDILWALSGRQFRNVQASETVTLEPLPDGCPPRFGYAFQHGYWVPVQRMQTRPSRVRLPRPDVTAITAVTLNGQPFSAYRRVGNYAVRTDGCAWPMVSSTLITYLFGRLVPHGGRLAAIMLSGELGKALAGKACMLPARVTSVTRQGVSFNMLEILEVLQAGLTGVYSVDQWIRSVNPQQKTGAGRVWSPDIVTAVYP